MTRPRLILLLYLVAVPASAHHPLGGTSLETFTQGLFSGIGHPLLGIDHLFFVVLVGIAAALRRRLLLAPVFYLAAMLGGCLIASLWRSTPLVEFIIALSLVTLGAMLLSGRQFRLQTFALSFITFGLFHGGAYGAILGGQEAGVSLPVLLGYLVGLALIQYAIALAAGWGCVYLWRTRTAAALPPRFAGAMVAGAGLYLALVQLEGALLGVLPS